MEIIKKEEMTSYSKEVIFVLDAEANFSQLNYAWTILTGHAIHESLQKPLASFVERVEDIQRLEKFILNHELDEFSIELNVKTCTFTKSVDACFYKVYDSNSHISICGIFIDITKYSESGGELMPQLTFDHQVRKKFDDLLNLFSHDLSSALAALFSSVELLEMISSSSKEAMVKKHDHYSNIKAQTQNINVLLDDFLLTWHRVYLREDENKWG